MSKTLQAVKLRNDFYRDNFRRAVFILLLSMMLNVVLIAAVFWTGTKPTKVVYFAASDSGRLVKMQPISSPVLSPASVRNWVARNVPLIYSLDYVHYRNQLNHIRQYFTPFGWNNFVKAFQPTMAKILTGQYVVSAAVTDVPYIVGSHVVNGVYTWKVQVPVKVTFRKGGEASTDNLIWQVIIQRRNNVDSNQMLGISQIVQNQSTDNS